MAKLTGIVADTLTTATASFNAAMLPASLNGGQSWTLTGPAGAMPAVVIGAVVQAGSLLVSLQFGAALSAGQTYTATAPGALTAAGAGLADVDKTVTFAAPMVDEPGDDLPLGVLEALSQAAGEILQDLAGVPVTRLVRDLVAGDLIAYVETTLNWASAGALWCKGRHYSYTSKTDASFKGLAVIGADDGQTLATGSPVVCDVAAVLPTATGQVFAQAEQGLRDTLTTKATGWAFDDLARWHGFPRIPTFGIEPWRAALHAIAYGPRGVPGTLQAVLEGMFADAAVDYACTVNPAAPQTLTWVSGGTDGGFTKCLVGRLWRIETSLGSGIYWSIGPTFNAGPATLGTLTLCRVATASWKGADWSTLPGVESVTAKLLPFLVKEATPGPEAPADTGSPCIVDLLFSTSDETPPTYMQPTFVWANKSTPGAAGAVRWIQPGETYAEVAAPAVADILAITAPGTWRNLQVDADAANGAVLAPDPEATPIPDPGPVAAPARGGSHVVTLYLNGVATALTCTLGAAATSAADTTHSVNVAPGDFVHVKIEAGAGVTSGLGNPRVSVFQDPPAGEPNGGDLLLDVTEDGDETVGPWPIYLTDDSVPLVANAVDLLLAAGIQVRARTVDFCSLDGVP